MQWRGRVRRDFSQHTSSPLTEMVRELHGAMLNGNANQQLSVNTRMLDADMKVAVNRWFRTFHMAYPIFARRSLID